MVTMQRTTTSPDETRALAAAIGGRCRGGEIILLHGDLGSGKTCFTQGLAQGLGVSPDTRVTSPTFTLHGEYEGRLILNHLDLYRLEEACALEGLGIDDMLGDPDAVTAIEWPEIMGEFAGDRLEIRISYDSERVRTFLLCAYGAKAEHVIQINNE